MKFILYFPFLSIVLVAYNIAMLAGVDFQANPTVFTIPHLMKVTPMVVGAADLLVGIGIILLFIEIVKAARKSQFATIDHMLSMVIFIIFLVELIVVSGAGTASFILLTLISLIDVIAGFAVTIATARRDISLGGDGMP